MNSTFSNAVPESAALHGLIQMLSTVSEHARDQPAADPTETADRRTAVIRRLSMALFRARGEDATMSEPQVRLMVARRLPELMTSNQIRSYLGIFYDALVSLSQQFSKEAAARMSLNSTFLNVMILVHSCDRMMLSLLRLEAR